MKYSKPISRSLAWICFFLILSSCTVPNNALTITSTPSIIASTLTPIHKNGDLLSTMQKGIGAQSTPSLVSAITVTPTLIVDTPNPDCGLLSEEPCGPPCFWGIIPGKTTKKDALRIIQTRIPLSICQEGTIRDDIYCPLSNLFSDDSSLTVEFTRLLVSRIDVKLSIHVSVDQVLEKFGVPDSVLVIPNYIPEDISNAHSYAILLYDKIKMSINLPIKMDGKFEILPEDLVVSFTYYDIYNFDRIRKCYSSEWKGYGEYPEQIICKE